MTEPKRDPWDVLFYASLACIAAALALAGDILARVMIYMQ
jgi:hypothetical protein